MNHKSLPFHFLGHLTKQGRERKGSKKPMTIYIHATVLAATGTTPATGHLLVETRLATEFFANGAGKGDKIVFVPSFRAAVERASLAQT
jgi:hypothetical protein